MIFFQQQSKKKSSFSKKSLFLKAISDKLFEDLKSKETLSLNIFWHKNDSNFWKGIFLWEKYLEKNSVILKMLTQLFIKKRYKLQSNKYKKIRLEKNKI